MSPRQSIAILLNDVREAYIKDQKAKGIRSSGKSAESLKISTDDSSGELTGAGYFYQQKFGRKPGKFPPIDDILDWIRAKKIKPRDPKTSERSLAYLFARKIAQSGTDIHMKKRPGIDVEEAIEKAMKEFTERFTKDFKTKIVTDLNKAAQQ